MTQPTTRPSKAPSRFVFLLLLVAVGLGACVNGDTGPEQEIFCPQATLIDDASRLVKFKGEGRDLTDVVYEAELQAIEFRCIYDDDDNVLDGELLLRFAASRGPAEEDRPARIRYFVAITTGGRRVVARQEFDLNLPFEGNRNSITVGEEISPRIPLRRGQDGSEFQVLVGLKLTAAQLEYNRKTR